MANVPPDRQSSDENAAQAVSESDVTVRHLLKARELLQEARSRLDGRTNRASAANPEHPPDGDDGK